jgi:hypothetical protein
MAAPGAADLGNDRMKLVAVGQLEFLLRHPDFLIESRAGWRWEPASQPGFWPGSAGKIYVVRSSVTFSRSSSGSVFFQLTHLRYSDVSS